MRGTPAPIQRLQKRLRTLNGQTHHFERKAGVRITPDQEGVSATKHLFTSISDNIKGLLSHLTEKAHVQNVLMAMRQDRIAKANQQLETKVCEGIGQRVGAIDKELFFFMREHHGYGCWNDPKFLDWFFKRHPEWALKLHVPFRIQVNGFKNGSKK